MNLHQVLSLAKSCVSFVPKHIRLVAFPRIPAQFMRPEVWIPDAIEPIYYTADECLEAIDKVQTQLWKMDCSNPDDYRDCLHTCAGHAYDMHKFIGQQYEEIAKLNEQLTIAKAEMLHREQLHAQELDKIRYMYNTAYER